MRIDEGGHHGHPPPQPRRPLRPRRRAQRRVLPRRARLRAVDRVALRGAAFLRADGSTNDHDLGLFESARRRRPRRPAAAPSGSTTWRGRSTRCATWRRWPRELAEAGALVGASDHSTTKSLYGQRPRRPGVRDRLDRPGRPARRRRAGRPQRASGRSTSPARSTRYGADTPGGIGVSRPLASTDVRRLGNAEPS